MKEMCGRHGAEFLEFEDMLLVPLKSLPEDFPKYKVFTPYYKRMSLFSVAKPRDLPKVTFYTKSNEMERSYP
jgi:hypothetical protein